MKRLAKDRPLVLDGGLSNVLEESGCDLDSALWTAGLLRTNPEAIVQAHVAYLRAGADIITTASYQASVPGFVNAGLSTEEGRGLMQHAVELADEARCRFLEESAPIDRSILIAASAGPYGAYLADGSEYSGVYEASDAELRDYHAPKIECLLETGADLLALETLPSLREIAVLAELLEAVDRPSWVSFCCRDGRHLHDGSQVTDAVELMRSVPCVFALGANCTPPAHIAELIRLVRKAAPRQRVVVYPNSGEIYRADTGTWVGTSDPEDWRGLVTEWVELGADVVGGCCRIGPAHIDIIRTVVDGMSGSHEGERSASI
jgi:homocysteine S-methyltransferase